MGERIQQAFRAVPRAQFLPEAQLHMQYIDAPIPIGYGQTNSQPSTVADMLEWLDVQPGDKVLDIGSGSGWTTALLSYLTGRNGFVMAVELVPELVEFGEENCTRAGVTNVVFYRATVDELGLPGSAPFDRVLVSASAAEMPQSLIVQLKTPGKLVVPVGNSIFEVTKSRNGAVRTKEHPGYVFVPLL